MSQDILLEMRDGGVAVVTMNRPAAMNALSITLRRAIAEVMTELRGDDTVRAIVLTGAGERAFTAGLDLKELGAGSANLSAAVDQDPASNPVRAVELAGKPVVGAINGVAITGGFELALACTMLIASENARFADTHALVGIMPGWGLSQKLSRIIGMARAKEMSFTGRFIDARTAYEWGLVNRVVAPELLLDDAIALATRVAGLDAEFLAAYNQLIDEGADMNLSQALAHETAFSSARNNAVTADEVEARRAGVLARGRAQT